MATWRNGPPALPPALAGGPDLPGMLRALRRRWFLALTLGLLCAGGALAAAYFGLTPRYTAFAQLYLKSIQPHIVFPDRDAGRGEFLTFQASQAARIKSRFVLNAALKRDEVKWLAVVQAQPDPLLWLEEELRVEYKEGAEHMTVAMTGVEPQTLVTIVNAVTQAYLQEITQEEPRRKSQRVAELDDILTKASLKLKQKKDLFRQRADELGTSDGPAVTQKQVNLLAILGEYRGQHARLRGDLLRAEGKLKSHQLQEKLMADPPVPEGPVTEVVEADPQVKQYLQRKAHVDDLIERYDKEALNPGELTRIRALQQRESITKSLESRMAYLRTEIAKRYKQKARDDYQTVLTQLKSELELIQENEKNLRDQLEALTKESEKIGTTSTEMELVRADIRREEKAIEQVGDESQRLTVELRSPPRVSLYQEAGVQKKDAKRQFMAMLVAPIGAFSAVCLCVAFFEFRSRRIQTSEEVATGLGMRVVGSVPAIAHKRAAGKGADLDEHTLLESIDGIRTLLLRDASVEATRVVMVTSAVSGEGKTTLASHLATSLARAGRKTLLIDSDLRRPAAHQLFELPLQPGLSEVLMREVHVAEATRSTAVDGLWMMPAGQWDREVMHALARDGIEEVFDKLKSEYDFIVVDSHPVLPANDSLLIGQHVDAVLLCVLRDVSQAPRVYAACQRLGTLGIRVLGAVVNGMEPDDCYGGYQYTAQTAQAG
ncbi:MAG: polysaccharide biosynthesis tyrosine autokinase [Gemmataceae bacterium]|nr:polysaccharide biosynthesis tyrosine autokinase [Gemmataceae bacterium]